MKRNEMKSKPALPVGTAVGASSDVLSGTNSSTTKHRPSFTTVRDSRNRRVPGLYIRNGRYYAQLWADRGDGKKTARRFPLLTADKVPVQNLIEAKESMEVLRSVRRQNELPKAGRKPTFSDYAEVYFSKATVNKKRAGTLENEKQAVGRWKSWLGHVRVDRIETSLIAGFVDARLKGGTFGGRVLKAVSERTANLDVLMLRNVLNAAMDDGHLQKLPAFKALKAAPSPEKRLITPTEFDSLIEAAGTCSKNGVQLVDYLRFLAFSGAREKEALRIQWSDVDLDARWVKIGADGQSKNGEQRKVEFNPQLGTHLDAMKKRRAPDSIWLFPSPQRGKVDLPAKTFRESLLKAREAAGLHWCGFHHLRHYFCSVCVMAGIDFMTIAKWLGHKDGGILIGKIYGHLLDEHRQKAAAKVVFGVPIVSRESAA
ncbi:MAG: site-specific integrase [Prosthecobacter sp.]|uniref:tyrosine-type recombinase/integrase n=1 Tax=Prosthecobacter sp. TaxID=1965333 RepID=UPI003BAF606A